MGMAIIRDRVEKIDGVSSTWIEWAWENSTWVKTLVVEVNFITDPNSYDFRRGVLDEIEKTALDTLNETTMVISHLKIVPKRFALHGQGTED